MGRTKGAKDLRARVNRILGQVKGIQGMVEEDRYCVDILVQIAAVRSALDRLGLELLMSHIEGCVLGHGEGKGHEQARPLCHEELAAELRSVLDRFLR